MIQDSAPDWEAAIRRVADELWEEGKNPTHLSLDEPIGKVLKRISTNLHRLCDRVAGRDMLPAPGERLV